MSMTPSSSTGITAEKIQRIMASQYQVFTYDEIKKITNDFEMCIGEGGFSKVYKGFMGSNPVAVKQFKKLNDKETPFLREIENMMYISHPNVIIIRGICCDVNPCIISDFMEKGSLQDVIDDKAGCIQLNRSQTLEIFVELCRALKDFHDKNFFHLDIKPSNILFDKRGTPKYADFNGSYFFDTEQTSYTFTHEGGYTLGYMDPFSLDRGSFAYHTDMYALGITMLALLTKKKNIREISSKREKIFLSNDMEKLKGYFTEEWCDEIGMRMLSCAMKCTKEKMKDRIQAKELAEELEKIKYEMEHAKMIKNFVELDLEGRELPKNISDKAPWILIRTEAFYSSSNELLKKIIEVFKDVSSLSKCITKEEISRLHFVPLDDDQQSENVFICHDVDGINLLLQSLLIVSHSIAFFNIKALDFVENIIIEKDIILQSNNKVKLNIKRNNFICIKGEVKVEMINFKIEDYERINQDYHAFYLKNGASLCMKDVIFRNNITCNSIIHVDPSCTLEMKDCTFDGNKNVKKGVPTCIVCQKESQVTLKDCTIKNHGSVEEAPYEYSDFLIVARGHISISNCTFENNLNDESKYGSILLEEKAEVTITNSTFKKCLKLRFIDKSKGVIRECRFKENGKKKYSGGALSLLDDAEVELDQCFFINNIAGQGGAIKCRNKSKISIKETIFDGNKTYDEKNGDGGTMLLLNESSGKVEDCRFINNHAITDGGALALWSQAKLEMKRCHFEKNVSSNGRGHSIYCERKSNIKELVDNVYIDSTEEDRSNVYIEKWL